MIMRYILAFIAHRHNSKFRFFILSLQQAGESCVVKFSKARFTAEFFIPELTLHVFGVDSKVVSVLN
jgi:hypothetical protein